MPTQLLLKDRATAERALTRYVILSLSTGVTLNNAASPYEILKAELPQVSGGYSPQVYAPVSSTYNSGTGKEELQSVTVTFTNTSGSAIQYDTLTLWQGRGSTANKVVSSVDTSANTVTVAAHGMTNGQKAFLTSTGSLPGGMPTDICYVESVTSSTLRFYTDSNLSSVVDLTSAGSGTIRLVYADGLPVEVYPVSLTTINDTGQQSIKVDLRLS